MKHFKSDVRKSSIRPNTFVQPISMLFGDRYPFKINIDNHIPLLEGNIDVEAFKKWFTRNIHDIDNFIDVENIQLATTKMFVTTKDLSSLTMSKFI
jgi:hypothetical protein